MGANESNAKRAARLRGWPGAAGGEAERRAPRNVEREEVDGGRRALGTDDDDGWVHGNPMSVCFLGRRHELLRQPWTIRAAGYGSARV